MTHPLQATLENSGNRWKLTITRDLPHPVEVVWPWLVDPERLRRWSPVVPDRALDSQGPAQIRENPDDDPVEGQVLEVEPPTRLVHRWGPDVLQWRLSPIDTGCRLTLEHEMADRDQSAQNAGGWHICLDVLTSVVDGKDVPRLVGNVVMGHGFPELRDGYQRLFDS